jgi:hypothetical protein
VSTGDILNADRLLKQAQAETGLSDHGDDTLPERFAQAVAHLRSCEMDEAGQRAAAGVSLGLLTSRLKFFENFKRYPLGKEKIERPVFATGEGRSGTTLLHALLSVDPQGRALRFWEVMYPSPPPGLAAPDDPRHAKADEDWRDIIQRMPNWLTSHPYNDMLGDGLPECERTWAFDFRVLTPTAWWRVPIVQKSSGLAADPTAQYRIHRMMLQSCQYGQRKKYWVLKGFHQARMRQLFEAYPDARVIWTHRDPVQVIASRIVLSGQIAEGMSGRPIDWKHYARTHLEAASASYLNAFNDPILDDPRIHHVRFKDLVANPISVLRDFYNRCDLPFDDRTEQAMNDYLKNNKSDRHGKFRYSTDIIGADIGVLNETFAPYRERFGVEIEHKK